MNWVFFAIGSAFFAGLTAILGKLGVEGINSNLATFIRTIVVLLVTAGIISARNEWQLPQHITAKPFTFLILSGVATAYLGFVIIVRCKWRPPLGLRPLINSVS